MGIQLTLCDNNDIFNYDTVSNKYHCLYFINIYDPFYVHVVHISTLIIIILCTSTL